VCGRKAFNALALLGYGKLGQGQLSNAQSETTIRGTMGDGARTH
jgi:hypothetical protein